MNKTVTIFFTLSLIAWCVLPGLLDAQEFSLWNNIRNSSYTAEEELFIRSELVPLFDANTSFYYYQQSLWQKGEMTHINGETYQSRVPANRQQTLYTRYHTVMPNDYFDFSEIFPGDADSLVIMMPGFLHNYSHPLTLNQLAKIGDDPADDVEEDVPPYLDITSSYFSFSDTQLHTAMTNNHTSFPTGPILGPYNFYTTMIFNPETVAQDTVFYGIIYGNILGIITPGLYRFAGASLEGLRRIGSVTHSVSGNTLFKSCLIDDLINDPYFGDWPGISNSLVIMHTTMRVNTSMEFTIGDTGRLSMQVFQKHFVSPHQNRLPTLTGLNIFRTPGFINLNVDYYDPDNHFPIVSEVVFDDETKVQLFPLSFDFADTVRFTAIFPDREIGGTVSFSDNGTDFVELPVSLNIEDHLQVSPGQPFRLSLYPNPFNAAHTEKMTIGFNALQHQQEQPDIRIYNIKGQLIREPAAISDNGGNALFSYVWDGRDAAGASAATGIYLIKVITANETAVGRVMLIR